jgi:hypothetical protein
MTNPLEAVGQDVQQEAAHKLVGRQRHGARGVGVFPILIGEGDAAAVDGEKAMVGENCSCLTPTIPLSSFHLS